MQGQNHFPPIQETHSSLALSHRCYQGSRCHVLLSVSAVSWRSHSLMVTCHFLSTCFIPMNLYTNRWAFSKPHRMTLSPLISGSHFLLTIPNCSSIHNNWPTPSWTPELLTQGNRFSWWVTIYHLDWVISDLEPTCYSMFSILLFHVLLGHWSIDYLPPLAWANSCSLVNFLCKWHFNK